jgi:RimJ/RimL family protein N-acetyltransferase
MNGRQRPPQKDKAMNNNLFQGELIRLTSADPEALGKNFSRWNRDSEYRRLLDTEHAQLWSEKKFKEWIEKDLDKEPQTDFFFDICTLEEDQVIGFIGLADIQWTHGDAWVGIGIGDRENWGRGFGTDAMRVILRYAFTELNLFRVTLGVFAYNPRAIHSYQKAGYTVEGIERGFLFRDGERADGLIMGILRSEWEASQAKD